MLVCVQLSIIRSLYHWIDASSHPVTQRVVPTCPHEFPYPISPPSSRVVKSFARTEKKPRDIYQYVRLRQTTASNTRRPLLTFVSAPLVSWTLAASPALLPVVGIMSAAVEEDVEEEEVSSLLPRPSLSSSSLSNTLNVFHACVRMLHPGDIERYQYMKLSHRHVHHFLTQFGGHTSIVFAQFRPGTNERTDRRHLFAVAAAARHHHPLLHTVLGSTWASNNSVYSSGK